MKKQKKFKKLSAQYSAPIPVSANIPKYVAVLPHDRYAILLHENRVYEAFMLGALYIVPIKEDVIITSFKEFEEVMKK